jgi:hypothetical protein
MGRGKSTDYFALVFVLAACNSISNLDSRIPSNQSVDYAREENMTG